MTEEQAIKYLTEAAGLVACILIVIAIKYHWIDNFFAQKGLNEYCSTAQKGKDFINTSIHIFKNNPSFSGAYWDGKFMSRPEIVRELKSMGVDLHYFDQANRGISMKFGTRIVIKDYVFGFVNKNRAFINSITREEYYT